MSVQSHEVSGGDALADIPDHIPDNAATPPDGRSGLVNTVLKNLFFFGAVFGGFYAVETGYFSNDRTSRHEWNEMERLKEKGKAVKVYEADFSKTKIDPTIQLPEGRWGYYNGASADTTRVDGGHLVLNYTSAWIGSEFRHTAFKPNGVYRVTFEAKVETEPAAILMRNRQMDLMREEISTTDGTFKTFSYVYVAPGGSLDQVRIIFMPDNRKQPKGKMTVRKFLIERLEG